MSAEDYEEFGSEEQRRPKFPPGTRIEDVEILETCGRRLAEAVYCFAIKTAGPRVFITRYEGRELEEAEMHQSICSLFLFAPAIGTRFAEVTR